MLSASLYGSLGRSTVETSEKLDFWDLSVVQKVKFAIIVDILTFQK